eukprot:scaffold99423_cov28-Tisochrysis_lutea.AAC.2
MRCGRSCPQCPRCSAPACAEARAQVHHSIHSRHRAAPRLWRGRCVGQSHPLRSHGSGRQRRVSSLREHQRPRVAQGARGIRRANGPSPGWHPAPGAA